MKNLKQKSYRKRIKITKQGKMLRRVSHQGHNQAKQPSKIKRQRKKLVPLSHPKYVKKLQKTFTINHYD